MPRTLHRKYGRLHDAIISSYEVTTDDGPTMSPMEAREASRLSRWYNRLLLQSMKVAGNQVDNMTFKVVSHVNGVSQLSLGWRAFLADNRLHSARIVKIAL